MGMTLYQLGKSHGNKAGVELAQWATKQNQTSNWNVRNHKIHSVKPKWD